MTNFSAGWSRRKFLRGAALVLPGAGLVGCGTEGGGAASPTPVTVSAGPAEPSTVSEVVAEVQANETTRAHLEYVNVAALKRFDSIRELGLGSLDAISHHVARLVGVDPELMSSRVLVGNRSAEAGLWFGDYDVARTDDWFAGNGGRREKSADGTLWRIEPDDGGDLLTEAGCTVARTAPGSFGWAVAPEPLTWLTRPATEPLAATPAHAEIAEGLEDAVAAMIQQSGAVTYAGGLHVSAADEVTEVVLARAASADQATVMLDNATRATRGGPLPSTSTVSRAGLVVRAAWPSRPGFPVGAFQAMVTVRKFEIFGS